MRPSRKARRDRVNGRNGAKGLRRISWPLGNYHRDGAQLVEILWKKHSAIAELQHMSQAHGNHPDCLKEF